MSQAWVLVDLANTNVFRSVYRPNPPLIAQRLKDFIMPLAESTMTFLPSGFWELWFRLYDGWFDPEGVVTSVHEMIRSHIRDDYPTRRRGYRVFVELAVSALAAREDRLVGTFREEEGLGPYRVSVLRQPPAGCYAPGSCSVSHFRSWVKGHCPAHNCTMLTGDVASFRRQKMVDTTLVADAVWAASKGGPIIIASDDEDVIPGLVTAKAFGGHVAWASATGTPRSQYAQLIATNRIMLIICS